MLPLVADNTNGRRESCHQLALTLDKFCNALMRNMQRFIEVDDSNGVETIWTCCISCLAHLTALSHLIGQSVPTLRSSMDDLYDLTLAKLGNLSREVHVEVYSHSDILTRVRTSVGFAQGEQGTNQGYRSDLFEKGARRHRYPCRIAPASRE